MIVSHLREMVKGSHQVRTFSPKVSYLTVILPLAGRLKRELSIQRYDMSSRRKCQTDIVNFFQQFDSKATDPQTVIQRILNSQSSELDLKSIRHNIRQYSKEEKAKIHTKIYTMAQFGQSAINSCILGLHSPKNEDIYTSLLFVRELLEITEAFTTNSER